MEKVMLQLFCLKYRIQLRLQSRLKEFQLASAQKARYVQVEGDVITFMLLYMHSLCAN